MATPVEWLSKFQVNTGTANTNSTEVPQIIGLSNGNFLVAWEEEGTTGVGTPAGDDIIGKIYDAEGNVVRDSFRLNQNRNGDNENDFDIAATNDGGFILVFVDNSTSSAGDTDIIYQRHNAAGNRTSETEIIADGAGGVTFLNPQITVNLQNNTSVIQYGNEQSGDGGLFFRSLNDTGGQIGGVTVVNDDAALDEFDGDIAMLLNGNVVSVWTDTEGGDDSIQYRVQTTAGTQVGGPFQLDVTGRNPQVTALANGNFVVVWEDYDALGGGANDIQAWVLSPTGSTLVGPFAVAAGVNNQNEPAVVALPDGDFVVVWDDDTSDDLFAQRFNPNGTTDGARFTVDNVGPFAPDVGVTGDGRILFTWQDNSAQDVFSSIWDPRSSPIDPGDYDNNTRIFLDTSVITTLPTSTTVNVTPGTTEVLGQDGNDTFVFDAASDINIGDNFEGGSGSDTLLFNARPQTFELGNATLSGINEIQFGNVGGGLMTIRMDAFQVGAGGFSSSGIIDFSGGAQDVLEVIMGTDSAVSLAGFTFQDYNNGTEDQIHIIGDGTSEFITGSSIDDQIFGNGGTDTLNGGGGNDTLNGGAGADTMTGGDGDDTYIVGLAGDVVIEAAGEGTDTVISYVNSYTLGSDVERLVLGGAAVTGEGNGDANTLVGTGGNNTLRGMSGNDYMVGGGGNDGMNGGGGADIMFGGTGDDQYTVGVFADRTIELAGQGIDTVVTYVSSYTMEDNVERMIMASSIYSASGNDLDNTIVGGSNANLIYGQGGSDYVLAGSGNDVIIGGNDGDTLFGQGGADRFDYNAISDSLAGAANRDQIADFQKGLDHIDLVSLLGGDSFVFRGTSAFTGTNEEVRFTTYGTNQVVDIDATGNGVADMQILLTNVAALDAGDFFL